MDKLRRWVALALVFTLVTTTLQGQNNDSQSGESYSTAYMESSHTAHWSVYIPITVLVVAAIYLGLSDRDHDHSRNSSDSQDGLGSINNSKRISCRCYSSSHSGHH